MYRVIGVNRLLGLIEVINRLTGERSIMRSFNRNLKVGQLINTVSKVDNV